MVLGHDCRWFPVDSESPAVANLSARTFKSLHPRKLVPLFCHLGALNVPTGELKESTFDSTVAGQRRTRHIKPPSKRDFRRDFRRDSSDQPFVIRSDSCGM
jgi:hypothetical protein